MINESLVLVLLLVLAAEFTNGFTDAPNAIATVVSTVSFTSTCDGYGGAAKYPLLLVTPADFPQSGGTSPYILSWHGCLPFLSALDLGLYLPYHFNIYCN